MQISYRRHRHSVAYIMRYVKTIPWEKPNQRNAAQPPQSASLASLTHKRDFFQTRVCFPRNKKEESTSRFYLFAKIQSVPHVYGKIVWLIPPHTQTSSMLGIFSFHMLSNVGEGCCSVSAQSVAFGRRIFATPFPPSILLPHPLYLRCGV